MVMASGSRMSGIMNQKLPRSMILASALSQIGKVRKKLRLNQRSESARVKNKRLRFSELFYFDPQALIGEHGAEALQHQIQASQKEQ
jgi:hypothetical protein